jgi:hypothetical protein
MGNRPSGDVDLFTSWQHRGEFPELTAAVADWRAHDPVQLAVGPVLHSDDAVANKVCALFGRALPRDFLDVDAVIMSGRYTREQLLELAAEADHGFGRLLYSRAGSRAEAGFLRDVADGAYELVQINRRRRQPRRRPRRAVLRSPVGYR